MERPTTLEDCPADLVLFGREDCHLCDLAQDVLAQAGIHPHLVDIEDDLEHLRRYAVRIPVLRHVATGDELDWPFDASAARNFLEAKNET